jgi:hypothetical protein
VFHNKWKYILIRIFFGYSNYFALCTRTRWQFRYHKTHASMHHYMRFDQHNRKPIIISLHILILIFAWGLVLVIFYDTFEVDFSTIQFATLINHSHKRTHSPSYKFQQILSQISNISLQHIQILNNLEWPYISLPKTQQHKQKNKQDSKHVFGK